MQKRHFTSKAALTDTAASMVAAHILQTLSHAPQASVFLSGGSTPGPVYTALSKMPLPWPQINIGLVDERWVDEDDAGSNAALVRRTLLQGQAGNARFVPMKTEAQTPAEGQPAIEQTYAPLLGPGSLAVLGMGPDGHTASWFPASAGLEAAIDPDGTSAVQAIRAKQSPVTGAFLDRMTLTLPALLKCETLILLISGAEKTKVFETALRTGSPDLPISHLLKRAGKRLHVLVLDA